MKVYLLTRAMRPLGDSPISWHCTRWEAKKALAEDRREQFTYKTGEKLTIRVRHIPDTPAGMVKFLNSIRHLSLP